MKDAINRKLEEHIRQLLGKPAISNEDYALLESYLAKMQEKGTGGDTSWIVPLLLTLGVFGGGHRE